MEFNVFPKFSYTNPKTKLFFKYVKLGRIEEISTMLTQNRYFVYEFDKVCLSSFFNDYSAD